LIATSKIERRDWSKPAAARAEIAAEGTAIGNDDEALFEANGFSPLPLDQSHSDRRLIHWSVSARTKCPLRTTASAG
jgi:hypothetical protein